MRAQRASVRRRVAAGVLAAVLPGCGAGESRAPGDASPSASRPSPSARCAPLGQPRPKPPAGLVRVRGAVVERVSETAPNVRVDGFIRLAPHDFLTRLERMSGVEVIFREEEADEAEALISAGRRRNFWKVVRACADGSTFIAIVL